MIDKTDNTPIWFQDIDGVINCWPRPNAQEQERYGPFKFVEVAGFGIWYRQETIDLINRLNREGLVRTVWATTWMDNAVTQFAPAVGLDEFPVIEAGRGHDFCDSPGWWKKVAVDAVLDGFDGKFVWTDDDIPPRLATSMRARHEDRCLVIATPSNPGLDSADLIDIEAFLTP